MRLKRRKASDDRDPSSCAASRCSAEPTIILATGKLDKGDVHLCDRHWQQHCDEQDAEHEAQKMIAELPRPKLPLGLKPGRYKFRYTDDLQLEVIP